MVEDVSLSEIEEVAYSEVVVTKRTAPVFFLDGKETDLWAPEYLRYHSRSTTDQIRDRIVEKEKLGEDVFPQIVGKQAEKELVKNALFSGSSILFRGDRGFGKTTFSKAIATLLEPKMLVVKDCKIHDDPTRPVCFSCKWKLTHEEKVDICWSPSVWVRIPGDPMLTTRQLIGGVSIQKLREGYDLDHPEVFVPGRALKANRGVGYFDELGAIPSSLQTMLHELLEEHQITTSEGELVPLKVDSVEIASTNPSNYRGTTAIKEPLIDRMEVIDIGPPETVEEEAEIAMRNMFYFRTRGKPAPIPVWHQRLMAQIIRVGRNGLKGRARLSAELSCRATIKLFDHVYSRVERRGGRFPLMIDYGPQYEAVRLALNGRLELEHGTRMAKEEIVLSMISEAVRSECKWMYDNYLPADRFEKILSELASLGESSPSGFILKPSEDLVRRLSANGVVARVLETMVGSPDVEEKVSALEAILGSLAGCSDYVTRSDGAYVVREASDDAQTSVQSS